MSKKEEVNQKWYPKVSEKVVFENIVSVFEVLSAVLAIANITAEWLNICLIKLVKEQSFILCSSKFAVCVILKEH